MITKIYETFRKILIVVSAVVVYTLTVVFVMCGIMMQCNITPADIFRIDIPDSACKGIAVGIMIVLAIIGIPGKKRNMGY